ncbi:RND efflux system, outer membrane lipoprotein, NodT family [Rhodopirellula islandica]|uniref:RND efflux system, outer membrane lipoprotein, NodT family n=2 Tax=Rhodopirellula islandica TaxID=595434 RepID=A0A0J1BGV0_RHOIS|nr:RND efflux system, outer membrane lipoprotein, NodT family [Rhodopirellula islandica]
MPQHYNWNNGMDSTSNPTVANDSGVPSEITPLVETASFVETAEPDESQEARKLSPTNTQLVSAKTDEEPKTFASYIQSTNFAPEPSSLVQEAVDAAERQSNQPAKIELANAPTQTVSSSVIDESGDHLIYDEADLNFGISTLQNSAQLPQSVFYTDPYLLDLITQAMVGNQELRILSEEIQIACNETYARSGEYRPFVTAGVGAGVEKSGRHTRDGAVEEQLEVAPGRGFPDPLPDFLVAANVSWEVDIWKRLRNAQNAAAMRYLATQEGRNYIITRLVAEVADNYYELLALDNRMLTLEKTIEIQQRSLDISNAMKEAGRGNQLAVQRFQAEVHKNESERAVIAQEIVEAENRINFLVGRYPQHVDRTEVNFIDLNMQTLSSGVPSELLQNRADIREAERQVVAAGLDIKVARARFYPSLTLTGGLGWNAFATGYLFRTPESLIYSVAGDIVGPLINKRAIQADYRTANAVQLQSIYNYQQTVLEAHVEVVNLVSKVDNYRSSIEIKKQQLQSLEESVDSAGKLFQNARVEYVEVLLAQRELMEAKMLLIDTKQEELSAIINAYQALGGGGF